MNIEARVLQLEKQARRHQYSKPLFVKQLDNGKFREFHTGKVMTKNQLSEYQQENKCMIMVDNLPEHDSPEDEQRINIS